MKIVTQVLDGVYGKSAVGVHACLARAGDNGWTMVAEAETNNDGCIEDWDARLLELGLYRIVFDSAGYFAGFGMTAAYPEVMAIFRMLDESYAFHVQVTLAPYSYSTYFGTVDDQHWNSR